MLSSSISHWVATCCFHDFVTLFTHVCFPSRWMGLKAPFVYESRKMGRAAKVQPVSFWDENSVLQVTANLSPLTAKKVAVNFDYFKIGGLVRTTSWLSMLFIMLSLVLKSTLWHMISYVPQQFEELTWSANSWRFSITNSQTHCSTTSHITDASTSWCCLQWAIVLCSGVGFCQRVPMWFAGNFLFFMKRRYFLTKGFRFCVEMWTI